MWAKYNFCAAMDGWDSLIAACALAALAECGIEGAVFYAARNIERCAAAASKANPGELVCVVVGEPAFDRVLETYVVGEPNVEVAGADGDKLGTLKEVRNHILWEILRDNGDKDFAAKGVHAFDSAFASEGPDMVGALKEVA